MALTGRGRFKGITVIPQTPDGLLRAFKFDAVLDTGESNPGEAFRHPVQNGAEGITDATRLMSPVLTCSGLVSDTPVDFFTPPGDRAIELYQLIKDIQRESQPVTVITSWLGEQRDRWPEMIEGRRGQDTGAAIEISITFVKFRLATTQVIPSFVDSDVLALGSQTVQTSF